MKILTIHCGNSGFFARFYTALSKDLLSKEHNSFYVGPSNTKNEKNKNLFNQYLVGSRWNWFIHYHLYKTTGIQDIFSLFATIQTCLHIKSIHPDIIHFHIIQEWYLNLPILFWYIKKTKIKVVWTMHDCRAFTGRCAYFDEIGCTKWQTKCYDCPQKKLYYPSYVDNTELTYLIRNKTFNSVNLNIVCPSEWLANLVRQSFLRNQRIQVIHNGINSKEFVYRPSNFSIIHNIQTKFIVLGVAANWENRKGLDTFIRLSKELPDNFAIVLVGNVGEDMQLPKTIIHIPRTNSVQELSEIYSAANLFVNPTIADNFPTTNMEAQACGTPVITYDTGGCGESIQPHTGIIIEKGNYCKLKESILSVYQNNPFCRESILASSKRFDIHEMTRKYIELYERIAE